MEHTFIVVNAIGLGVVLATASRRIWRGGPSPSKDEWFWLAIASVIAIISLK